MTATKPTPWRKLTTPDDVADRLIALYESDGNARYDEAVTQTEHALQAADLARVSGADDALIAAALLHDIGHLLDGDSAGRAAFRERDLHHEEVAARFLSRWFGPEVVEPIRHHVAAKRYLCAVEPAYGATLSPASVRSLELQGGVMNDIETVEFEQADGTLAGVELRRWDDLAKDPDRKVPPIRSYRDLLAGLVRTAVPHGS